MTMRFLGLLLALAFAMASTAAKAETNHVRVLSLDDCIKIALEHNLDVQITRMNPELNRLSLSGVYAAYEPTFSVSGSHDYSLSPGGLDSQGRNFGGTESESDNFSAGFSGLTPWGLRYGLSGSISDRYGTQPSATIDPNNQTIVTNSFVDINSGNTVSYLSTNFGTVPIRLPFENTSGNAGFLELRQPVLKNFWIDSTRLQIFLRKQDLKTSELGLRSQVMTTVTAVEQAYYDLIFALENVRVQEKGLELAERLVSENRRRVEVGALAPLDEKQAESRAAASRADLISAQAAMATQQRVLKSLLSDNYEEWKDTHVSPTESLIALPEVLDLQESWRRGLAQRPDLAQAKISLESQGTLVRYQKNQLFPELDLVGRYGYSASSREFSGAFGQLGSMDNPFYSYGAQLSVPLGNTGARSSYRSAKATKEQIALQLKQVEQNVLIGIENAMATARTSLERVAATRQARLYAEDALKAEEKKLEQGKSTSFIVLQLQSELTAARSSEIRSLADYNIALARLALNEGSTFTRRKIDISVK